MCAQVGGRRKLGHSDAVFRTCGGARGTAPGGNQGGARGHITRDGRHRARHPRRARVRALAVLCGVREQSLHLIVVDHLVVPGNRHARGGARPSCPPCREAACKPATATLSSGPPEHGCKVGNAKGGFPRLAYQQSQASTPGLGSRVSGK